MNITIHQTDQTIADFDAIFLYLKNQFVNNRPQDGIHLFPESFLCGYPLQDLCLVKSYIEKYKQLLDKINELAQSFVPGNYVLLLGGIKYQLQASGVPSFLHNVVYTLAPSSTLNPIYSKQLLPNYDIFDEKKYFTAGNQNGIFEWNEKKIGVLICEDMWVSSIHKIDPCANLKNELNQKKIKLDLLVNLSASPFNLGKYQKRFARGMELSNTFECPFIYANKVGGEDEVQFDGRSFICDGQEVIQSAASFKADKITVDLSTITGRYLTNFSPVAEVSNIWEELFKPRIAKDAQNQARITPLVKTYAEDCLMALQFGLQQYANKNNLNNFCVALSGGIDSALVLAITKLSLKEGQKLEAIYMPSIYSSSLSYDLSLKLCQNLGVRLTSLPIKFLHSTAKNLFEQTFDAAFSGLTDENIQSRLRSNLLMARANQTNAMAINTSNKSELAVGYSTIYGDSVGAISLLGDLYKTEVYELAKYINKCYPELIPTEIISRAPSAELRPDQHDQESLPDYETLDVILEGLLSYQMSKDDLVALGLNKQDIEKTIGLYVNSEYKRHQFAPIIKIHSKSFGFGHRMPINKCNKIFY